MAQYTCTIWANSGFNEINIPDGPGLINGMSHTDLPVIDLNQERFLPEVRVRAAWSVVRDVDYCKVGDFYYFVNNVFMASADVAVLSLTPDFVTSAGGPASMKILDGMTERVHVSNDSFGKYVEDDPYLLPAYNMDVVTDTFSGDFSRASLYTFVETTLDLKAMGDDVDNGTQPAITAVDAQNATVTYPYSRSLGQGGAGASSDSKTSYKISNFGGTAIDLISIDGQGLYEDGAAAAATWKKGVSAARSMGVEQAISGRFTIPAVFVGGRTLNSNTGFVTDITGQSATRPLYYAPFKFGTNPSSVKNNRVFYGSITPYYLCSAAGNIMSCNAEDIYPASGDAVRPSVTFIADPRRTGKPYFRFQWLNGLNAENDIRDVFRNGVAGREWRSAPMVFTEKSGSAIDMMRFNTKRQLDMIAYRQAQENETYKDIKTAWGAVLNLTKTPSAYADIMDSAFNWQHTMQNTTMRMAAENQEMGVKMGCVAPDVNFAGEPDLLSEITGNGFVVYRPVYSDADIARVDKILTAYGYKHTKVLEASDFNNRTYFNFVKAGVSVGDLPRWWAAGIAAQLAVGVRVWHVAPNPSYYTNNPVRT